MNGYSETRTIEHTDSDHGTTKLTYQTYMDGVDPYYVSYIKGKIEIQGTQVRRWSTSETA